MDTVKIVNRIKIANVVAVCLFVPIMLVGALYGLDAFFKNGLADPWAVATLGYFIAFIFSLLAFKKSYFLYASLIGWMIFGLGSSADHRKALDENDRLCMELRADSSCVEDECGFTCPDMVTGAGICKDKDLSLCQQKTKNTLKNEDDTRDVLKVYSSIVDKIIASPSPASENFENQLVATYNCLGKKLGPGADGELKAVQILTQKNLTEQQLNKYYTYLSSKGRNVNTQRIVAGLPGGDKSLSCEYIGVK